MEDRRLVRKIVSIALGLLLAAGLAYQAAGAGRYLTGRFTAKVLANRRLDAVLRSADGSYGSDFAAYIAFLRSAIPEEAQVLIPPRQGSHYDLNDSPLMQYFLFPRRIETCPSDCAEKIAEPGTYIVVQDDFPPADLVPAAKRLTLFSPGLGLYLPGK